MTNMNIYKSLGGLDPALVAMAAPAERVRKKKKTAWIGWVSAAACFVLLFSVSAWMFVPGLGTYEDCLISMLVPIDDEYYVAYHSGLRDMSNFDRLTLGGRIGEVFRAYETSTLYKIKGHDDIAELICVWDDGRILLLRAGSVEVLDTHIEPPTLDFLLKTVYGVRSAADIKCVRFEKITKSNTDFSKKVKVKTVTVTDKEQLARLYAIFCTLQDGEIERTEAINQHSEAYKNGTMPLSIQINRKVTVEFENGTSVAFDFDPQDKYLSRGGRNYFQGFTDADMAWLISLAKINMQHVDYGTDEQEIVGGEGMETTSRPAAP